MTLWALAGRAAHRPAPVVALAGVLWLLGITATGGGMALLLGAAQPPADWLDGIPVVDTWTVPALVLGFGFGVGSLLVGYGVWRRPRWPWPAGRHGRPAVDGADRGAADPRCRGGR